MIEFNLKRIKGNKSVTHGRLEIPQANFKCHTLELVDGTDLMYKQNCSLSIGNYQLMRGFHQDSAMYPVLRFKPLGFSRKPCIVLDSGHYRELMNGCIALGTKILDDFSIDQPFDFRNKVKEVFRLICAENDIMVLRIYKSNKFEFEDTSFESTLQGIEGMNYYEEEDDEQ